MKSTLFLYFTTVISRICRIFAQNYLLKCFFLLGNNDHKGYSPQNLTLSLSFHS